MTSHRQPALFAGHGSPMYAIEPNRFTDAWSTFGKSLQRPDAVLVISAHWLTRGVWVTAMSRPKTVHDFTGFSDKLHAFEYPAPGSPALADRVQELLNLPIVLEENEWGLDHGAWSVLKYLYPHADVPVVQLSLDASLSAAEHYDLAKRLRPLRDENILIVASGNVVHNLQAMDWQEDLEPYKWAQAFNDLFISEISSHHHENLIYWKRYGDAALLSIPSPEHYWPALYTLALQEENEHATVLINGLVMRSISMLSFTIQ